MVAQIDKKMALGRPFKLIARLGAWALIEGRQITTRGRWINPLVFAGYKAMQYTGLRDGSEQPIFILGTGRSGTTVLGKLFAYHRETVFLNEPLAAWNFVYPHEDVIGSYSSALGTFRIDPSSASTTIARRLARIYSWAMRLGMVNRVVDKYPELVFRIPFVVKLFPAARFITIIRDGVNTCSSVVNWSIRKGVEVDGLKHDWWGVDDRKWRQMVDELIDEQPDLAPHKAALRKNSDDRDRSAVEWIVTMREAMRAMQSYPEQLLVIRYEDLCANPTQIISKITDHCGLEPDPGLISYARQILEEAGSYSNIELCDYLVEPFQSTLTQIGYAQSSHRVKTRQS